MTFFNTSAKNAPAIKFQNIGDAFDGFITGPIAQRQARDFTTKQPKFYKPRPGQAQGDPIMEGVIPVTDHQGVSGTIYVTSKLMRRAIEDALIAAGAEQPAEGGRLFLQYSGTDSSSGFNAKAFTARYAAPAGGAPVAAAQAAPVPAVAQAAPADHGFQHAPAAQAVAQGGYAQPAAPAGYAQPAGYDTQAAAPAGYYPPAY